MKYEPTKEALETALQAAAPHIIEADKRELNILNGETENYQFLEMLAEIGMAAIRQFDNGDPVDTLDKFSLDFIEAVMPHIIAYYEQEKWKPIGDCPKGYNVDYLISGGEIWEDEYDESGGIPNNMVYFDKNTLCIATFIGGKLYKNGSVHHEIRDATHFQLLPKPPKEA